MEEGRCPICAYEGSTVSPADAAVALRSFPRRFRETFDALEKSGDRFNALEVLTRAGWVARALEVVDGDLGRVLVSDRPPVSPPALDGSAGSPAASEDADAVLAHLTSATTNLAARAGNVAADDWKRTGRRPDGSEVSALDLLRHAVHIGVHQLRECRRPLADDDPEG